MPALTKVVSFPAREIAARIPRTAAATTSPATASCRLLQPSRTFPSTTTPLRQTQTSRIAHGTIRSISSSVPSSKASFKIASTVAMQPTVHGEYEARTGSWQYIVSDPSTRKAVIIDPVLDFDSCTGTVSTKSADSLLDLVKQNSYYVEMILETHAHADHMTAASYLRKRLEQQQGYAPLLGIGKRIKQVQQTFCERYKMSDQECKGSFDKLFEDDEPFKVGSLEASAIHVPGHTPDHMGYKIGENVFVGDSIFHVDLGSARADFPGGNAEALFKSGRKLLSLPEQTRIWIGHDYPPEGREAIASMTVAEHRQQNKHLKDSIGQEEYVALREQRDATLAEPKLLHQSLQMNLRGGRLPEPSEAGLRMLHLPLNTRSVGIEW